MFSFLYFLTFTLFPYTESTFRHCDWTQRHRGVELIHILKAKRRVEGFGEGASEGVEVVQF